ncbi:MAG: hypothetical protein A2X56_11780 [Nitrospirae bacterium GWC2_57_13]|nr:MAG: hypothetical protein A2X56_11780 [Nitrospirae bacterium GWC2_57_13]HAS54376.1 hypothetical protein [Nitrospiraceae bacterium]
MAQPRRLKSACQKLYAYPFLLRLYFIILQWFTCKVKNNGVKFYIEPLFEHLYVPFRWPGILISAPITQLFFKKTLIEFPNQCLLVVIRCNIRQKIDRFIFIYTIFGTIVNTFRL